jgi:Skp family chaperone for outer membrane proteins
MTTTLDANARRRLRDLDERKARAWSAYQESLRDLEGTEYDEAESRCWDRLQRKLQEVERQRAELVAHGAGAS